MSNQNHPNLSIVIPAYNEEQRLPPTLATLAHFFETAPYSSEVVVVVERSTDATLALARSFAEAHPGFRVIGADTRRGKGFAVKTGALAATGGIIFFMDADLSVPVGAIDTFYETFRADPALQILVGNRQHAGSEIVKAQGWLRRSMGQTFNHIVRAFSGLPLRDTQCGFKAFRREVAHDLFARQTIDGFAFDVELLLLARRASLTMRDLPVEWHNSEDSHVHIVRDSLAMLRDVLRVRLGR